MTINIETLRFEIQLNKLDNSQMVLSPLVVGELLDRLEEAEKAWKISDQTVYDLTEKVIPNIQEKLETAEKERDDVLEALKEIMPFTATVNIGCHGEKCREPWCHSCNSEEEAEAAAQKGCDAWAKARAAIARATGEQS